MKATEFQEATIDAALACFDRPDGPRRYLVADEVGMGKTVVARGVMGRMIERNNGVPLNVLYVCSNLAVARQNRDNLLRGDFLTEDQRRRACVQVDRLGVVVRADDALRANSSTPLRLFTLTPGTSLPDWKDGRTGTGTMYERATAQALLEHAFARRLPVDALQVSTSRNWAGHLAEARAHFGRRKLAPDLAERFRAQVAALVQRPAGEIPDWLEAKALLRPHPRRPLYNGLRPHLGAFRASCCLLALELIRPDVVIFDEFQRFPEIVTVRPSLTPHKNALVSALRSDTGPSRTALLLLSATPYRMYAGAGEGDTHEEFLAVTRFLLGGSVENPELRRLAGEQIEALRGGLAGLARAFNSQVVNAEAIASRNSAERVLRSVMARTERSDGEEGAVPRATSRETQAESPIELEKVRPVDLLVFKHMVDLRRRNRGRAGTDVAFWQSIPLPTQSMYGYKSAVILKDPKDPKPPAEAFLTKKSRDELRTSAVEAHPRMRALVKACRPADLGLPWVAPSVSWWPLRGGWKDGGPRKVLAFSRFVAVPRTVPALLSHATEAAAFRGTTRPGRLLGAFDGGGIKLGTLALFLPVPFLAIMANPLVFLGGRKNGQPEMVDATTTTLTTVLQKALKERLVVTGHAPARSPGRLLPLLLGMLPSKLVGELEVGTGLPAGAADHATTTEWRRLVGEGRRVSRLEVRPVDLVRLAEIGLFGPANVLYRALHRHGLPCPHAVYSLCWSDLRSYLGHPVITAALGRATTPLRRKGRTGDAGARLLAAVYDGNLESVLDEHLWVLKGQQGTALRTQEELLRQVGRLFGIAKLLTPSAKEGAVRLRCHAALPFRGDEKGVSAGDGGEQGRDLAVRPDLVRSVFNSPFWPHVLVTTSVGQEGLDFHPWCERIAHWDLPGSPVEYEQREGRISRFAGLSVRRALARERGAEALTQSRRKATESNESVWSRLAASATEGCDGATKGLSPWWVHPDARIERLFLSVQGSEVAAHREHLDRLRRLYRLVLGQPDQAHLLERIAQGDVDLLSRLRLRLSPGFIGSRAEEEFAAAAEATPPDSPTVVSPHARGART